VQTLIQSDFFQAGSAEMRARVASIVNMYVGAVELNGVFLGGIC